MPETRFEGFLKKNGLRHRQFFQLGPEVLDNGADAYPLVPFNGQVCSIVQVGAVRRCPVMQGYNLPIVV